MTRVRSLIVTAALFAVSIPAPAAAQGQSTPIQLRGVPSGPPTAAPLNLTLADAIHRGLEQNLAVILQEQQLKGTESARLDALSELLPHVSGSVRQSDQTLSTAAFGFTLPGLPTVIGPFGVFDARVGVSTPLFDARAIGGLRAGNALVRAGQADVRDVRETIVLAVGTLYLQVRADAARVESAQAQVATAEALVRLADDQRAAGIVAGIDVVRQQVQLQSARARLIVAENAFEKRKLSLARAIGLPAGQVFTLSDTTTFTAAPPMTTERGGGGGGGASRGSEGRRGARRGGARSASAPRRRATCRACISTPTSARSASAHRISNGPTPSPRPCACRSSRAANGAPGCSAPTSSCASAKPSWPISKGGIRYDVSAALLDLKAADAGVQRRGQRANALAAGARPGAGPLPRRRREHARARPGAGSRRERQRAVHRQRLRARGREGHARARDR